MYFKIKKCNVFMATVTERTRLNTCKYAFCSCGFYMLYMNFVSKPVPSPPVIALITYRELSSSMPYAVLIICCFKR